MFGILPPLIYAAGVPMSWREFRFNFRPIALFAIGCVIFTACAIAFAAHWLLGCHWPSHLYWAQIAPPDVVAPLAIARRLGLPRRLVVVLEGEGLANDATALILYRFAVAAVSTGLFSFAQATGTFALIVIGEIAFGVGIGWLSLRLRRWVRDPRVEITLSLMTPYVAFWVPAEVGGSGVLATVAAGLYVSWNGPLLIPAATRLQGIFFWDLVVYYLEGLIFLVMGLQARTLIERMNEFSPQELAFGIFWLWGCRTFPIYLGLSRRLRAALASPALAKRTLRPGSGLSSSLLSVSEASSHSRPRSDFPSTTATGAPFPYRDLILFITFGTIVVTLIGQGLLLPRLVLLLRLNCDSIVERQREREAEHRARRDALKVAKLRLDELANGNDLPEGVLSSLLTRHDIGRAVCIILQAKPWGLKWLPLVPTFAPSLLRPSENTSSVCCKKGALPTRFAGAWSGSWTSRKRASPARGKAVWSHRSESRFRRLQRGHQVAGGGSYIICALQYIYCIAAWLCVLLPSLGVSSLDFRAVSSMNGLFFVVLRAYGFHSFSI